jgi:hypothetical protein
MLKVVVLSLIKEVRSAKVSLVIPVGYAMVFKKNLLSDQTKRTIQQNDHSRRLIMLPVMYLQGRHCRILSFYS